MKLAIVTGAKGKLGENYVKEFSKKDFECLAIVRSNPSELINGVVYKNANLLDKRQVKKALKDIEWRKYEEIIIAHPVGMFKFEEYGIPSKDTDMDGIDDEIFASNVLTFTNLFSIICKSLSKITVKPKIKILAFGSITHDYNIPFWQSYTKSKQILKDSIKKAINKGDMQVKCVFVNVSTVDTGNERNLRPFGNRRYWLSTGEIVSVSLKYLNKKENWTEINVYKDNPKFNPTWYTNHENVLKRWKEQMNG